jgi:hypothetical protein
VLRIIHQWSFNEMQTLILVTISLLLVVVSYLKVLRPWQLRWGAIDDEVKCSMPGDDIVQKPNFVATRAVLIEAPRTEVWKWILQIGSGRAGFYSIDFIDNANVPSSRDILPKYQRIEQDYFIPFTPNQKNGMWVEDYREPEYILWWDRKRNGTWGWFLRQTEAGNTRLITRLRTKYDFSFPWIIYYILYDCGDIIMMSKCMLGIKERAEKIRVPSIAKPFSQVLNKYDVNTGDSHE